MFDGENAAAGIVKEISDARPVIQDLRRLGWSYNRIADHLNTSDVTSPTRWKGKPAPWHGKSVKRFMNQPPPDAPSPPTASSAPPDPPPAPSAPPDPPAASSAPHLPSIPSSALPYPSNQVNGAITVEANGVAITLQGVSGTVTVTCPVPRSSTANGETQEAARPPPAPSTIIRLSQIGRTYPPLGLSLPFTCPLGQALIPTTPFFLRGRV